MTLPVYLCDQSKEESNEQKEDTHPVININERDNNNNYSKERQTQTTLTSIKSSLGSRERGKEMPRVEEEEEKVKGLLIA